MAYAIFLILNLLAIASMIHGWLKGVDEKVDPKSFPCFLVFAIIEGLLLFTTLIPPTAGAFAGVLFGYWVFIHILAGRGVLNGKTVKASKLGWSALIAGVFVGLVTISFFGG